MRNTAQRAVALLSLAAVLSAVNGASLPAAAQHARVRATAAPTADAAAASAVPPDAPLDGSAAERPCAEGRERISGRCCWPEQTWSDDMGRCVGAPACPDTLVEHGESCILSELAPLSAFGGEDDATPAPDAPSAMPQQGEGPARAAARPMDYPITTPPGYGGGRRSAYFGESVDEWPSMQGNPDAPSQRVIVARGEDEGLIIAALSVFDMGWLFGWLGTWIDEASGGGCMEFGGGFGGSRRVSCEGWGWSFVPVIGALASAMTTRSGTFHSSGWGIGFGITSVIFQGIGGIMAIIAFANETTERTLQPFVTTTGLSATLVPGAAGADAGLTLALTF